MDIEPRLATVETQIGSVTGQLRELANDVRELSNTLRDQGVRVEGEIQKLLVGLTVAAAPRRTDWQAMLTGIGLVLAVGAAALSPIYLRIGDIQDQVVKQEKTISSQSKYFLAQQTLIIKELKTELQRDLSHVVEVANLHYEMNQREFYEKTSTLRSLIDRLMIQQYQTQRDDIDELRMWRHTKEK
jgi:hypothetical protein